jgi:apolipoprotein N-acyltransferase
LPSADAVYNSVFLIDRGQVQPGRYDKVGLTPFGEVMPYISAWPRLQDLLLDFGAHGMKFNLSAGTRPQGFRISTSSGPPVAIATPICFEATKPALCRWLINAQGPGPKVIVNLTNDGWFGHFVPGRWQHLQVARWRAVELGVPVVRVANTGVSAAIDARGRLVKSGVEGEPGAARTDGVLLADVAPGGGRTIYARLGDVLGWSALIAGAALVGLALLRRPPVSAATPDAQPRP